MRPGRSACRVVQPATSATLVSLARFVPERWTGLEPATCTLAYGLAFIVFPGLLLLTDSEFNKNSVNATYGRALFVVRYFSYGALVGWVIETLDQPSSPAVNPTKIRAAT